MASNQKGRDNLAAEMAALHERVEELHLAVSDSERAAAVASIQRDVSLSLASIIDLSEGLKVAIDAAISISGMDCGGVYLVDEASGSVDLLYHTGLSDEFISVSKHFDADTPNAKLIMDGTAHYVDYPHMGADRYAARQREGLLSVAVLPLTHRRKAIGCINIGSHKSMVVAEPARAVLEAVAAQVGSAIVRIRAEQDLHSMELRFRSVVEASPMGIHMYDLQKDDRLVFVGANPAADSILGVDNGFFVGKTIEEAFPPLGQTEVPERYRKAASSGDSWQTEQVSYKDEKITGAFEVFAFQTNPGSMAALFRDITERKRAEEELLFKTTVLEAQVETSLDAIVVIDSRGGIVSHNKQFVEMWDIPQEIMAAGDGKAVLEHIARRVPGRVDLVVPNEDREAQDDVKKRDQLELKDGRVIDRYTSSLTDASGRRRGRIVYFRDVTERLDLELKQRHSQKMEAIGRLAGGIAHDFNNLLTGIMGYADLLKLDEVPGSRVHEASCVIERAASRAADLTKQLLGFARRGKYQEAMLDLHRVVHDTIAIVGRTVDKRIKISLRLMASPSTVKGDPGQLEQVMMNLAVNAKDAMSSGGELVVETSNMDLGEEYCRTHVEVTPGRYVLLSVGDTGVGMSDQVQERIFEPFFTTKPLGEGTGMGLATAYGIVENHGGHIAVYSELGHGTTFKVFLPVEDSAEARVASVRSTAPIRGTGTILVVDDEESVQMTARSILMSLGYDVVLVSDGREAVDYYKDHSSEIDLVVLDMTMPVMDGRECFEELKRINPAVKSILATGHALNGEAQRLLDNGVLRFVQKPFTVAQLSQAVAKAMA